MDSIIRKKKDEEHLQASYMPLVNKLFELPDGREETYTCIAKSDIVTIFMLTSDQKVVVTQQYRPGPEMILFDCPGGNVEHNDLTSAAKQEIEEETGYSYENLSYLGWTWHDAYDNRKRHMFIATGCKAPVVEHTNSDENEFISVIEISLKEYANMLMQGDRMNDAIMGYKALVYLKYLQ